MVDLPMTFAEQDIAFGSVMVNPAQKKVNGVRLHEIYENTTYIPNTSLRLLEIPMNSSLTFQKLLWYHSTFNWIYFILMLGGQFHRINRINPFDGLNIISFVIFILMFFHVPIEIFRIRFGYNGNINETFPELIAFLIFTIFFVIPLSALPLFQTFLYPHELSTCLINVAFVFSELIMGFVVMRQFMKTQSAAFYLRTAPLIDKLFGKKYAGSMDIGAVREIQLGMQRYDKERDHNKPFKESDEFIEDLKEKQRQNQNAQSQ